jgi:hypothetical protein
MPTSQALGDLLAGAAGAPVNRPQLNAFVANSQATNGLRSAQTEEALLNAQRSQDEQIASGQLEDAFVQSGARPAQAHLMAVAARMHAGSAVNAMDMFKAYNATVLGDPAKLNIPSLVQANCLLSCSWTRTVTATRAGSWQSSAEMIQGAMDISVSPASFSLAAGESQELVITAHFNAQSKTGWQFASLVLAEGQQKLKMPVSVKFKAGTGPDG